VTQIQCIALCNMARVSRIHWHMEVCKDRRLQNIGTYGSMSGHNFPEYIKIGNYVRTRVSRLQRRTELWSEVGPSEADFFRTVNRGFESITLVLRRT